MIVFIADYNNYLIFLKFNKFNIFYYKQEIIANEIILGKILLKHVIRNVGVNQ